MKKISLILSLILIASVSGCVPMGIAFAASETIYTTVLEDLQKDETFDVANYPAKDKLSDNDKVMDVIQIAESNAGELFLYVYQPMQGKFTASEVRISQSIGDNLAPQDCKLTLLSRDETLEKYKVEGLQVKSDAVRYYLIVQLVRPWDKDVDGKSPNNEVTTVPYSIEKKYTACTIDGKVSYIEEHNDVITVTDKWFGFVRYSNGYKLYKDSCDAWFIAFNTDMQIDNLYDADVSFMSQKFGLGYNPMQGWFYGAGTEKEPSLHTVKLTDKDTAETKADGLFAYKYKWNRIESVDEFKKNETLSDDYIENVKGKTWVRRFTETDYSYFMSTYTGTQEYTVISDVTILRLHFKSNGRVYNLGVVDNKTSNADGPVNEDTEAFDGLLKKLQAFWDSIVAFFEQIGAWLSKYWWILLIIVGVIALGLLSAFVKPVAKVLWWILKIVFYIVTLPVWLIIWGVRAIKKNKQ